MDTDTWPGEFLIDLWVVRYPATCRGITIPGVWGRESKV